MSPPAPVNVNMLGKLLPVVLLLSCGPPPPAQPPATRQAPEVKVLEGMLERLEQREQRGESSGRGRTGGESIQACLDRARLETSEQCKLDARSERTYQVRVALDKAYQRSWPDWEQRFFGTFACLNQIYRSTGTRFELEAVVDWEPGAQRNNLDALLDRVQAEVPANKDVLRLGVVVWSERRVQSQVGGEIGLSQAGACVVPAWPRVENDCITLAHELGHLVGARHVPGKNWIMSWKGHTYRLPVSDPLARVVANHRLHPRNKEGIRVHHKATGTRHGLALDRGCALRLARVDSCWALTGLR